MALTNGFAIKAGTKKAPELADDFVDGLQFTVSTAISSATIVAGNFTVSTTATIDATWPASGHFFINGRQFTYGAISGANFTSCNGPYGDQAVVAISAGEVGYQAPPAAFGNLALQRLIAGLVYQAASQTGLNVTIAPFRLFDGTTEMSYAGGTLALTDNATNYVYAYNNSGAAAVAKNTTSWANPAIPLVPLAKIVTSGGAITVASYVDERPALALALPGELTIPVTVAQGGTNATTASGARTNLGLAIGTDVEAYNALLAAIAALNGSTGFPAATGSGTAALRSLTVSSGNANLANSVTNPAGVAGNPVITFTLANPARSIYLNASVGDGALSGTNSGEYHEYAANNTTEVINFTWQTPDNWDAGTISVSVDSYCPSYVAGGTVFLFGCKAGCAADGDTASTFAYGTAQTITTGPNSDTYWLKTFAAITASNTPAAGKLMHIQVYRDSTGGFPVTQFPGKVRMYGIRIKYTTTSNSE